MMGIGERLLRALGLSGGKGRVLRDNPQKGLYRARWARRSDDEPYEGAGDYDELSGWGGVSAATPNYNIASSVDKVRSRARHAARNNSLISGYIGQCVRAVVGSKGFSWKPCNPRWRADAKMARLYEALGRAIVVQSRKENFTEQMSMSRLEFEQHAVRCLMRDGELLVMRVRNADNETGYTLRALDPDMLASSYTATMNAPMYNEANGNRIIAGVEIDAKFRVKAFHFRDNWKKPTYASLYTYTTGEIMRIPAEDVLLLFRMDYTNQVRGMSPLDVVLRDLESLQRYKRTLIMAARKAAGTSLAVETPEKEVGQGTYNNTANEASDYNAGDDADNRPAPVMDINGKIIPILGPGDKLHHYAPNYPHEAVTPYIEAEKKAIAVGLQTAPVKLTGNYGEINYSAGQLMHKDDEEQWRIIQQMVCAFLTWWHGDWVQYAMERGSIVDDNGRPLGMTRPNMDALKDIKWYGRVFTPVDAQKQAQANKTAVEAGVKSRRAIIEEEGGDAEEIFNELNEESKMQFVKAAKPAPKPAAGGGGGGSGGGKKSGEE